MTGIENAKNNISDFIRTAIGNCKIWLVVGGVVGRLLNRVEQVERLTECLALLVLSSKASISPELSSGLIFKLNSCLIQSSSRDGTTSLFISQCNLIYNHLKMDLICTPFCKTL